jgi:aminoglycoside phosphotransferase family enzyme/predicted kinase
VTASIPPPHPASPPPSGAETGRDQSATVAFLSTLASGPPVETHISYVFLGSDTVWKLKKAVRLPFLDFTELASRQHFCERELALNQPAAPGLYRDVAPIVRRPDGSLSIGGADGTIIDWVVRMGRVPHGDFLDIRAATTGLSDRLLDQIADAIAAFHTALPPLPDVRPDMEKIAEGNVPSALSAGLPEPEVLAWRDAVLSALRRIAGWRDERSAAGYTRRCHGDLHLGNMCLWHGQPVPFDALEFDETLARVDVAYDLAFLLMDLEHRVDRTAANRVMNRYVARTGDAGLVTGLPVFQSIRAMVRAHVEARSGHAGQVGPYLAAAFAYLRPPGALVIGIGGLPGAGKSTLARALAPALGAAPGALIQRSDEIRKRQHGVEPERRLPDTAYSEDASTAVFRELAQLTELAAAGGHAVIADATFMDPAHRAMIEAAARRAAVPFIGVWLTAPAGILEQRIGGRTGDASDADLAVLRGALRHDPGAGAWHAVDAVDATAARDAVQALVKTIASSHIVS